LKWPSVELENTEEPAPLQTMAATKTKLQSCSRQQSFTRNRRTEAPNSGDISESARFVKVKFSKHLLCEWSLQPLVR